MVRRRKTTLTGGLLQNVDVHDSPPSTCRSRAQASRSVGDTARGRLFDAGILSSALPTGIRPFTHGMTMSWPAVRGVTGASYFGGSLITRWVEIRTKSLAIATSSKGVG